MENESISPNNIIILFIVIGVVIVAFSLSNSSNSSSNSSGSGKTSSGGGSGSRKGTGQGSGGSDGLDPERVKEYYIYINNSDKEGRRNQLEARTAYDASVKQSREQADQLLQNYFDLIDEDYVVTGAQTSNFNLSDALKQLNSSFTTRCQALLDMQGASAMIWGSFIIDASSMLDPSVTPEIRDKIFTRFFDAQEAWSQRYDSAVESIMQTYIAQTKHIASEDLVACNAWRRLVTDSNIETNSEHFLDKKFIHDDIVSGSSKWGLALVLGAFGKSGSSYEKHFKDESETRYDSDLFSTGFKFDYVCDHYSVIVDKANLMLASQTAAQTAAITALATIYNNQPYISNYLAPYVAKGQGKGFKNLLSEHAQIILSNSKSVIKNV